MDLVILIGLPASGKTTFARRFRGSHVYVSKDLMPRSAAKERRQHEQIAEALRAGRSVVVDNVNGTREARARLIAQAGDFGARVVGYFFESEPGACLARNRQRVGPAQVPAVAIFAAAKKLQPPEADEGFDALFRVRLRADNGTDDVDVVPMAGPEAAPATGGQE